MPRVPRRGAVDAVFVCKLTPKKCVCSSQVYIAPPHKLSHNFHTIGPALARRHNGLVANLPIVHSLAGQTNSVGKGNRIVAILLIESLKRETQEVTRMIFHAHNSLIGGDVLEPIAAIDIVSLGIAVAHRCVGGGHRIVPNVGIEVEVFRK